MTLSTYFQITFPHLPHPFNRPPWRGELAGLSQGSRISAFLACSEACFLGQASPWVGVECPEDTPLPSDGISVPAALPLAGGLCGQLRSALRSLCAASLLDPLIPAGGPGPRPLPSLLPKPDDRSLLSVSLDLPLLDALCSKDSRNPLPWLVSSTEHSVSSVRQCPMRLRASLRFTAEWHPGVAGPSLACSFSSVNEHQCSS